MELYELKQEIQNYLDNYYTSELSNTAPVLSKYLSIHKGIEIKGSFSTDDGTALGRPMYVTVLRQADKPAVTDGFGFAVIKGNSTITRDTYNVFIVDNNIVRGELVFGNVLQVPTMNSYVTGGAGIATAGKAVIQPNVKYNFKFSIMEDWSTELYIWVDGEDISQSSWPTMPDGALKSGAVSGGPLGFGGREIQSPITGEMVSLPTGTEFGFAVDNPSGYKWKVSAVEIRKLAGGLPAQIFEFENNSLITGQVQVNYFGSGEYVDGQGVTKSLPVDIFIAKVDTTDNTQYQNFASWEKLGSTVDTETVPRLRKATSTAAINYEINGRFYIAATCNFTSVPDIDLNTASIKTDFIEVTRAQNHPILDRAAIDIWVDPINIIEKAQLGTDNTLTLDPSGLTVINTAIHPIFLIEKIYTPGNPAVNFLETGEIKIYNDLKGYQYSQKDVLKLSHPDLPAIPIRIDYWNCGTKGEALQKFVTDSKYRGPAQDHLIRICPPTVFRIDSLYYKGNRTVDEVTSAIIGYITNLNIYGTVSKNEILSLLYSMGVTYINLGQLSMSLDIYDYIEGFKERLVLSDEYARPSTPGRWYTNESYLNIVKQ